MKRAGTTEVNKGKMLTLRAAVILGVGLSAGSAVGTTADVLIQAPVHGVGHVVAAAATLWFVERLDRLIADDNENTRRRR